MRWSGPMTTKRHGADLVISARLLLFDTLLFFILEYMKFYNGQPKETALMNIAFFISTTIIYHLFGYNNIFFIPLVLFSAAEVISWRYNNTAINYQILHSMNFKWVLATNKIFFLPISLIILGAIILAIIRSKWVYKPSLSIKFKYYFFMIMIASIVTFLYLKHFNLAFHSFLVAETAINEKSGIIAERFRKYLTKSMKILNDTRTTRKKNIIIIEVESLEKQLIGRWNKWYKNSMPNLNKMTEKGILIENIYPQPYNSWTTGSLFAQLCSLPHVISEVLAHTMEVSGQINQWPNVKCLPDILKDFGYKNYYVATGNQNIMGKPEFFRQHNTKYLDFETHNTTHDMDTYNYTKNVLFPKLKLKQPFMLIQMNLDTHPNFWVDPRCNPPTDLPKVLRCYTCFDEILGDYIDFLKRSDILDQTIVVIIGDHLGYGKNRGLFVDPRTLFWHFPFEKDKVITKPVTLYDFSPTLLDLLGYVVDPEFTFGKSILKEEPGSFPQNKEFNMIYTFFKNIISIQSKEIQCGGKTGFCNDTNVYLKDREVFASYDLGNQNNTYKNKNFK